MISFRHMEIIQLYDDDMRVNIRSVLLVFRALKATILFITPSYFTAVPCAECRMQSAERKQDEATEGCSVVMFTKQNIDE